MAYRKDGGVDLRRLPRIVRRKLGKENADGQAIETMDEVILEYDSRLTGRRRLETILHEALHLACPWMNEHQVLRTARYQAMVLHYIDKNPEE